MCGVLTGRDLVTDEEALHLLNSHRVEEHADELEEDDDGGFHGVSRRRIYVTKATSGQRGSHKVKSRHILVLEVVRFDTPRAHPARLKVAERA